MAVEVEKVQSVTGGYGFNIKATTPSRRTPASWMTLVYETNEAAEAGRALVLRAVEKATSALLPPGR